MFVLDKPSLQKMLPSATWQRICRSEVNCWFVQLLCLWLKKPSAESNWERIIGSHTRDKSWCYRTVNWAAKILKYKADLFPFPLLSLKLFFVKVWRYSYIHYGCQSAVNHHSGYYLCWYFHGLHLNLDKTIVYSPVQTQLVTVSGVQIDSRPVKYLGAFLGSGDLLQMNFEMPLRKLRIKMNKWNKRHLSLFARVTVTKTFLYSLFTHVLNSIFITTDQLNFLQLLLNEFLWRGWGKIKQSTCCAQVKDGGLNMIHVKNCVHFLRVK